MRSAWALILVLLAGLLCGCSAKENAGSDDGAAVELQIVEPKTGAGLWVSVDRDSIELVEALTVRATMRWVDGVWVELIEPDWEGLGWSVESMRPGVVIFTGEGYERVDEFVVSPYLSGTYVVDGFGIRATSAEAGKRIARLAALEVTVESVLNESDGSEIEGSATLAALTAEEKADGTALIALIAGLCVLVGIGGVTYARRSADAGDSSMDAESVVMVSAAAERLSDDDVGQLHRALVVLGSEHAGISEIAQEIELVRFSGQEIDHSRIRDAAHRAARICGVAG